MSGVEAKKVLLVEAPIYVDVLAERVNELIKSNGLIVCQMDSLPRGIVGEINQRRAVAAITHVFLTGTLWAELVVAAHQMGKIVIASISTETIEGQKMLEEIKSSGMTTVVKSRKTNYPDVIATTLMETLKQRGII